VGFQTVTVYRSQDEGKSFQVLSTVKDQPGAAKIHESMTVELRDGRIALFVRTLSGIRGQFLPTAAAPRATLKHCRGVHAVVDARFFLRRLKSGHLLLVYNRPPEGPDPLATRVPLVKLRQLRERVQMAAVLSEGDGVTWKGGLRLDDRDSPSYRQDESPHRRIEKLTTYPSGVQTDDGTIWLTCESTGAAAMSTTKGTAHPITTLRCPLT